MLTVSVASLTIQVEGLGAHQSAQLLEIITRLTTIEGKINDMILTEAQLDDLLTKIDGTTNATATNVSAIATADQKISDEIDAFVLATPAGTTLTDAQVAKLQAIADRAQLTSDASTAQVSILQAIAAKGAPAAPPPPPPVVVGP